MPYSKGCFCGFATIVCALCLIHFFKTDSNDTSLQDQFALNAISVDSDKENLSSNESLVKRVFSKLNNKFTLNRTYANDTDMVSVDSGYALLSVNKDNDDENNTNIMQGAKLV
jgi:hypothetical protein